MSTLLSAEATRGTTRHQKRQDYNTQPSYYQSGFVDNDIAVQYPAGVQYPSGPTGGDKSSYALFKKAEEDDRKPVMFPSPPPPEREETTQAPTQEAAPSERYISVSLKYWRPHSVQQNHDELKITSLELDRFGTRKFENTHVLLLLTSVILLKNV